MTEYTTHADVIFDVTKPVIGATNLQARDNLIAVAEADATAPKLKRRVSSGFVNSGQTVIGGIESYQGFIANIIVRTSSGTSKTIQMELSDNGTTFYGLSTLFTLDASSSSTARMSMDTSTGEYQIIYGHGRSTGTFSGSSSAVTHVRFTVGSATSIAVMIEPNGGNPA